MHTVRPLIDSEGKDTRNQISIRFRIFTRDRAILSRVLFFATTQLSSRGFVSGTTATFRAYGLICLVVLGGFVFINFYRKDTGFVADLPPTEDPHQVAEATHLAPHGVPSNAIPRALSSTRLHELGNQDYQANTRYQNRLQPTDGPNIGTNGGELSFSHPSVRLISLRCSHTLQAWWTQRIHSWTVEAAVEVAIITVWLAKARTSISVGASRFSKIILTRTSTRWRRLLKLLRNTLSYISWYTMLPYQFSNRERNDFSNRTFSFLPSSSTMKWSAENSTWLNHRR